MLNTQNEFNCKNHGLNLMTKDLSQIVEEEYVSTIDNVGKSHLTKVPPIFSESGIMKSSLSKRTASKHKPQNFFTQFSPPFSTPHKPAPFLNPKNRKTSPNNQVPVLNKKVAKSPNPNPFNTEPNSIEIREKNYSTNIVSGKLFNRFLTNKNNESDPKIDVSGELRKVPDFNTDSSTNNQTKTRDEIKDHTELENIKELSEQSQTLKHASQSRAGLSFRNSTIHNEPRSMKKFLNINSLGNYNLEPEIDESPLRVEQVLLESITKEKPKNTEANVNNIRVSRYNSFNPNTNSKKEFTSGLTVHNNTFNVVYNINVVDKPRDSFVRVGIYMDLPS